MIKSFSLQNKGISKEFSGKSLPEIQSICNNLNIEYECLEYNTHSIIIIEKDGYVSLFISTGETGNKYFPLQLSPVKK